MDKEYVDVFRQVLRQYIDELEKEKNTVEKKLKKIVNNFNVNDIQKLNNLANEVSNINHTTFHMYALIGGLDEIINKQMK